MSRMDCQSLLRALHRYVDGECPSAERTAVEVHLGQCAECRMTLRALRGEVEALSTALLRDEPPADLYERVVGRLPSPRAMFFIRNRRALVAVAAVLAAAVSAIFAAGHLVGRPRPVAIVEAAGRPLLQPPSSDQWQTLDGQRHVEPGSLLRAPDGHTAAVEFEDWTQLTLRAGTRVVINGRQGGVEHRWRLQRGELWAVFGQGRFRIDTAAGSVAGEACELLVRVTGFGAPVEARRWPRLALLPSAHAEAPPGSCRTTVTVVRGSARAWNPHGSVELRSGTETQLEPGRPPLPPRPANLARALAWTRPPQPEAGGGVAAAAGPVALASPLPEAKRLEPTPVGAPKAKAPTAPAKVAPSRQAPTPKVEEPPPGPPTALEARALVGGSVELRWKRPATGARAVAYKVWRKGEGEERYRQLTIPSLAAPAAEAALSHYDHTIAQGRRYHYRLSALDAAGREGPMGEPVAITACDFEMSYTGGNLNQAMVFITKRVRDSWVTHQFIVHKREVAKGHSGIVGGPVRKVLRDGPQVVDFSTGYRLLDIVRAWRPETRDVSFRLVLEDRQGRRSFLWQEVTRSNGH